MLGLLLLLGVNFVFAMTAESARADGTVARDISSAVQAAPDDGGLVVVLLHGSDWNATGEQFRKSIFQSPAFRSQLPPAVVLTSIDIPEAQDPSETGHPLSDVPVRTYPCLVILDGVGRPLTVLQPVAQYQSPGELAQPILKWLSQTQQRDRLLAQARNSQGIEQARLIGQALRAGGAGLGPQLKTSRRHSLQDALDLMKKSDPQDQSQWIFAIEFPYQAVVQSTHQLRKDKGLAAAEQELDRFLANPHLEPSQRQRLQQQRFLLYKDDGQPLERQLQILDKIHQEDPDSTIGQGARRWADHLRQK